MKLYLKPDTPPYHHRPTPIPVSKIEFTHDERGPTFLKCQATDQRGHLFELTLFPNEIDRIEEEDAK